MKGFVARRLHFLVVYEGIFGLKIRSHGEEKRSMESNNLEGIFED